MKRTATCLGIALVLLRSACALPPGPSPFSADWEMLLADASRWQARPDWLPNASPGARLEAEPDARRFRVPEAGRGMKWVLPFPPVSVTETPYLLLTYRARGLDTASDNYFIYLDDGNPAETRPVLLRDMVADGNPHTICRDLAEIVHDPAIDLLAIQVQCREPAGAEVEITRLAFVESPPAGILPQEDATVPGLPPRHLVDAALQWDPKPDWLPNPAAEHSVARAGDRLEFGVETPGQGMKWAAVFDGPVSMRRFRHLAFTYRARGVSSGGEYTFCIMGRTADGKDDYMGLVVPASLRADGRTRTIRVRTAAAAARFPEITGIAVQLQAGDAGPARLEIESVALTDEEPLLDFETWLGDRRTRLPATYTFHDLPEGDGIPLGEVLRACGVTGEPDPGESVADGIPFRVPAPDATVPVSGLRRRNDTDIPLSVACDRLFLLTAFVLKGTEEAVYGNPGPMASIREPDRFRVELRYDDGTRDEAFPFNASSGTFDVGDGAQVLCLYPDPARKLVGVRLLDRCETAGFAVLGLTGARNSDLFPEGAEDDPKEAPPEPPGEPVVERPPELRRDGDALRFSCGTLAGTLALSPVLHPVDWENTRTGGRVLPGAGMPLFGVTVDGTTVPPQLFRLTSCDTTAAGATATYGARTAEHDLRLVIRIALRPPGDIVMDASCAIESGPEASVAAEGPVLGPVRHAATAADDQYVFPKEGWLYHTRPVDATARYGGGFPLQFMVSFNPAAGSSLSLRTEDTTGLPRDYGLLKDARGTVMRVAYPARRLLPGEALATVPTVITGGTGDWHDTFTAYRDWLRSRYRPRQPRSAQFREVFNFRQRFLHSYDPLCDTRAGTYRLSEGISADAARFGGVDFLHLFDWGSSPVYGRIYGRTGDYSPFDELPGGREGLARAIAEVRAAGTPVGLYIEGYLLEERGKLGQQHGKAWQLTAPSGRGIYWPDSSEMMICPWVEPWRAVQETTYAGRAGELAVDGMYVDQFGFANPGKDCFSPVHGHPVPGYADPGERGMLQRIRASLATAVPGAVLYTEEMPSDVNSQWQDGSFTYHMRLCRMSAPLVPLHLPRFAIPSFKTFEILVCDKPTGSWAEGVELTFFNGEGLWLEGPPDDWFAPDTLEAIRRCHQVLRDHRDAFTCDDPTPLVPTLASGLYANRFATPEKDVYTLFNTRHRTRRGPLLAVPHVPGMRVESPLPGTAVQVRIAGGTAVIEGEVGPRRAHCIVVQAPAQAPDPL